MAYIFLFLSPRSILVFEKIYFPLQNLFIFFFYQFKSLPFKVLKIADLKSIQKVYLNLS
jgi:hypothetical protein